MQVRPSHAQVRPNLRKLAWVIFGLSREFNANEIVQKPLFEKSFMFFISNSIFHLSFRLLREDVNENKPLLLATFENLGWEVAKQLLSFLVIFEPKYV